MSERLNVHLTLGGGRERGSRAEELTSKSQGLTWQESSVLDEIGGEMEVVSLCCDVPNIGGAGG